MANLKQIKAKIKSVGNLKKITRALEVVSTVKLQKIKTQAEGLKYYLQQVMVILSQIGQQADLFIQEETSNQQIAKRRAVIVVSSERGLCAGLNAKLLRKVIHDNDLTTTDFFVIGKKGLEFLKRAGATIVGHVSVSDKLIQKELLPLFAFFDQAVSDGVYSDVQISFNYFKNSIMQIPTTMQMYPLTLSDIHDFFDSIGVSYDATNTIDADMLVEPDLETIRNEARRQIRNYVIMSALVQNKAGEHAARMIAMKNAKDNATGFVKSLTLKFNKERQGAITKEISEIVSAKIAIEG